MPFAWLQISCGLTFLTSEWMPTKLATPGRFSGSYVTSDVKSVMARLIFLRIAAGGSRNVIRLLSFGSDFDCFFDGSRSDRIRPLASCPIIGSVTGKVSPNLLLKTLAKCEANWSCCNWSSPQGTCVALERKWKFLTEILKRIENVSIWMWNFLVEKLRNILNSKITFSKRD